MPSTQPDVLFILCDQYRWDCLAGHPVAETPNLDQLAARGTRFTAAYSSCPSCIAARASIFTGLHPTNHGRLGYYDKVPWNYEHMLAEVLRGGGYQTHCVGKTHFYPQRKHCGFESLDSYEGEQNLDGDYVSDYHEWLREKTNGRLRDRDTGLDGNSWVARPSALPEELHNNTWVVTKAMEFVRRRDKTRPFFLNVSFHRPHPPIDPPEVFWNMYRDVELPPLPAGDWAPMHDKPVGDVNAWEGRLTPRRLELARRGYYAQIAHIDNQIGRLLLSLRSRRGDRPLAIVFTADHGEMLGDHHLFRKTYAYQGSAGVPLLIQAPGCEGGGVCETAAVLEDLYPTILSIAGVKPPRPADGVDLLPLCRGEGIRRVHVHGEHSACYDPEEAMQFMTDGREKYIWFTRSGREQLFDLAADPEECHDLAPDPAARERLEAWRTRMIARLSERTEDSLSDGEKLIPGTLLPAVRPRLMEF